ncbi:MAG: MATE family efflux transporter [Clostridia bacterium]|nr:MATE family efflux transporter [Clostridia bacterium]
MNNTRELGERPIGALLAKYSIPAVIAMLVNAIYNVVDRIFIGQYAGEAALAGLTIVFPVMMITFAFSSLIGAGGASLLAIKLGEKNEREANHVFGNTLSLGFIVTGTMVLILMANLNGALSIFGATPEIIHYANVYLKIILMGTVFQMMGFVLNSTLRTEGKPILSMVSMIAAAVTNIILDYLFIGIFDMGVAGAAYATIAGQFVGLGILLSYYLRRKSILHPRGKDFIPEINIFIQIITIGFATFVSTVGTSVAMTFINRSLSVYGGLAAVTSLGAINSLFTFFIMPIMGITQGMQPIIGYNYGARQLDRSISTLKYGLMIGIVFSTVIFSLLELFPRQFVGLFLENGSATVDVAVNGLRIFIAMLPLLSINLMGVAYFQSTANGKVSMVLGMLRQFIFLLPLVLILPNYFGLNGVWMAAPIADGLAIAITGMMLLRDVKIKQSVQPILSEA